MRNGSELLGKPGYYWLIISVGLHALVLFVGWQSVGEGPPGFARNELAIQLLATTEPLSVARDQLEVVSTDVVATNYSQAAVAGDGALADHPASQIADPPESIMPEERGPVRETSSSLDAGAVVASGNKVSLVEAVPLGQGNQRPKYPRVARQRGWEGEVLVWVAVNSLGVVRQGGVERSSGYSSLDRSALRAVLNWRFSPASRDGVFVESLVFVPVSFKLEKL